MNIPDFIATYIAAYNANDIHGMLREFHQDCIFEHVAQGKVSVSAKGAVELEALMRASSAIFETRHQSITRQAASGDLIFAEIEFRGVLTQSAEEPVHERTVIGRGVSIFSHSASKIMRLTDYMG